MDVGTLVTRAAARWPDRIAVEGPDASGTSQQLTFAQLGDRVVRLANALRHGLGLQPGDRVLDLQTNTTTYLETDLAIRSAGLVRVALNHRLHPSDWQRIADDCGAVALVHHMRFSEDVAPIAEGLGTDRVVVTGAPGMPGAYEDLLDGASTALLPALDPDAFCGLHYSSGTTGHPKGAQRTHRNWVASVVNMTHDVLAGPGRVRPLAGDPVRPAGRGAGDERADVHVRPFCSRCRGPRTSLAPRRGRGSRRW
jgi:acyl-CoA synthetase (AMP-forming)/AMP-acid ligase II